MEQGAQCPQESAGVLEQLFWWHQHHDDQGALGQVFRPVSSTVQPIPATLLTVATLVTMVVFVVVCTVFVISRQREAENMVRPQGSSTCFPLGMNVDFPTHLLWLRLDPKCPLKPSVTLSLTSSSIYSLYTLASVSAL